MLFTMQRPKIFVILLLALGMQIASFWGESFTTPALAEEPVVGSTPVPANNPANDSAARLLYLPSVQHAKGQATPVPSVTASATPTDSPTATTTPIPPPLANGFFADTQWRTSSASFATDAQGGNHLAYLFYHGLAENVPNTGVYAFCAKDCDKLSQWQSVRLGQEVNEIQLALTPQGDPRILYRTRDTNNGWRFFYGACDDQCTDAGHWTVTHIASNQGTAPIEYKDDELPQRYFALDNAGRPRFVYIDQAPMHYGAFYVFCDQQCNDANHWHDVRINKDNGNVGQYRDEDFYYPALTFSTAGQPRIVADGASMQDEFFLYYIACDAECGKAEQWQSTPIFPRGAGFEFSYDVEINAAGNPRIAIYEAAYVEGGGNVLSYAWCNGGCTQGSNWQRSPLGLAILDGQEPDLELDSDGRPHIAYALYVDGGVGYSVCAANCESTGAQWQHKVVENRTALALSWTVAHPPNCSGGVWDGLTPSLSLDGKGNPHIAYDATYYARCHYVGADKWEPWSEMNLVWRAVRVRLSGSGATAGGPTPTVTPSATPSGTPGTPTSTATSTATATATATGTPTLPPPARLGSGVFPETTWRTSSSDIAIDSNNGAHLAYVYTEAIFGPDPDGATNPTTAVYRYCAGACDQAQNWSSVTLGEAVSEVQIGLTPNDKPRLLLLVRAEQAGEVADRYIYAECNQNCTSNAGWQLATVVTLPSDLSRHWIDDPQSFDDVARETQARRNFALDPDGRPRFVYYHYNAESNPNGVGAYYAACDAGCTDPLNWTHTRLTQISDWSGTLEWEVLEKPVLEFTPEGNPRILAAMLPLGVLRFPGLYYMACDGACTDESNWQKVQVGNSDDASGEWDLGIDPAGRPYLVISYWWQDGLRYGWCDTNCLDSANWQVVQGPELEVKAPELVMAAQGQPRVVYHTTEYDETGNHEEHSLYYLWCDANCRSTDAHWQRVRIENSENLRAEWPQSLPTACAEGKWYQLVPSLAFDSANNARVAVDVSYIGRCEYDAGSGTWQDNGNSSYSTVWRAARSLTFPLP